MPAYTYDFPEAVESSLQEILLFPTTHYTYKGQGMDKRWAVSYRQSVATPRVLNPLSEELEGLGNAKLHRSCYKESFLKKERNKREMIVAHRSNRHAQEVYCIGHIYHWQAHCSRMTTKNPSQQRTKVARLYCMHA